MTGKGLLLIIFLGIVITLTLQLAFPALGNGVCLVGGICLFVIGKALNILK